MRNPKPANNMTWISMITEEMFDVISNVSVTNTIITGILL